MFNAHRSVRGIRGKTAFIQITYKNQFTVYDASGNNEIDLRGRTENGMVQFLAAGEAGKTII